MARRFNTSTFRPTIKETQSGECYIIFELREGVNIPDIDSGEREAAILFPKGTPESFVKRMQEALNQKGMKIAYIE